MSNSFSVFYFLFFFYEGYVFPLQRRWSVNWLVGWLGWDLGFLLYFYFLFLHERRKKQRYWDGYIDLPVLSQVNLRHVIT